MDIPEWIDCICNNGKCKNACLVVLNGQLPWFGTLLSAICKVLQKIKYKNMTWPSCAGQFINWTYGGYIWVYRYEYRDERWGESIHYWHRFTRNVVSFKHCLTQRKFKRNLILKGSWWGCEVSCGGHHRQRGKSTTGSALGGAVFDIAQILAYLVHNMSRSHLYLGFGHFGWLPSFLVNNILAG